ncbi:Calponin-3 [Liparis tanakae]|uniref:Calponin-3 n=1 Tax=Liparis tanakae TaxID=230148 RepID=A0A4Z2EDT7_9TELE|nr:Calponin-3 [Liparis tanakae]
MFYCQIAQKYDSQREEELRFWIEEVTGTTIGENFQRGLKDGVVLCELINKLQTGSVKKINLSQLNWHKLENLGNFIKAILAYGLKPNDIFEANDLFESGNMTQVQTTLLALASMAKTKGMDTKFDIGVKYADKQARHFDHEKIKAGQCVIGLQVAMMMMMMTMMTMMMMTMMMMKSTCEPLRVPTVREKSWNFKTYFQAWKRRKNPQINGNMLFSSDNLKDKHTVCFGILIVSLNTIFLYFFM